MNKTSPRLRHKTGFAILGLTAVAVVCVYVGIGYLRGLFQSEMPSSMFSEMCGNEVYQEVYAPNGQYKVVVFERNCGATTGFSTQVSILGATQELPNISGNIFVIDGHPDYTQVQVKWESDQAIDVIYADGYEVDYQQETFRNASQVFKIQYGVVANE